MDILNSLVNLWHTTGLYNIVWQQAVMIVVCLFILWLGIVKKFEPLLLIPIGFGGLLSNIPVAAISALPVAVAGPDGVVTTTVVGGFWDRFILSVYNRVFSPCLFLWAWAR